MAHGEVGRCNDGVFLATRNCGKLLGGKSTSNSNRCTSSLTQQFFLFLFLLLTL